MRITAAASYFKIFRGGMHPDPPRGAWALCTFPWILNQFPLFFHGPFPSLILPYLIMGHNCGVYGLKVKRSASQERVPGFDPR